MSVIDSNVSAKAADGAVFEQTYGAHPMVPWDETHSRKVIGVGQVTIDTDAHQVYSDGSEVLLTPKEYQTLIYFVRNPHRAVSVKELREQIWKTPQPGASKAVSVTVSRLRKKLGWSDELKAVWKVGYRLNLDPRRQ